MCQVNRRVCIHTDGLFVSHVPFSRVLDGVGPRHIGEVALARASCRRADPSRDFGHVRVPDDFTLAADRSTLLERKLV